jgi:hypothetical protein
MNEKLRLLIRLLTLVAVVTLLWWLLFCDKDNSLSLESDELINPTPEQIQSIKAIGQWEFLSISTEELVDTVRRNLLRDDELARIYYGTLRLGFDMSDVAISTQGDSILLSLPRITLLDRDFIDEARTKAFHESGTWTARDREALYQKARRQMLRHALTPANIKAAQNNADAQMRRMMTAMGYNNITIEWNY